LNEVVSRLGGTLWGGKGEGLDHLPNRPASRGRIRDVEMKDFAAFMGQDQEDILNRRPSIFSSRGWWQDENPQQYFRAYHAIRERARGLVPRELREKYERQVRAGQALYVDQTFALRQPNPEQYLTFRMTPEDRVKWFEHNTYWALYTTDEYVWCYSERMNWWKNETPPGLEPAIVSARQKLAEGKPLGFDIESLITAAEKR
jgi:hypothetical protein